MLLLPDSAGLTVDKIRTNSEKQPWMVNENIVSARRIVSQPFLNTAYPADKRVVRSSCLLFRLQDFSRLIKEASLHLEQRK